VVYVHRMLRRLVLAFVIGFLATKSVRLVSACPLHVATGTLDLHLVSVRQVSSLFNGRSPEEEARWAPTATLSFAIDGEGANRVDFSDGTWAVFP
jgi:hypothetical protein